MSAPKPITNPFPGLRPFETNEYRLFFGREGQSDALIERLRRARFLAVVGTSGSGKSSLVRAGLLPALRGGMMAGAGWRMAVMRPGHDPIGNLARELTAEGALSELGAGLARAEAEAIVEATLRRGSLGLVDAVRQARIGSHEKLLVVVDQFEELFRFRTARMATDTDDDASAFVKLLLEARQADRPAEERLPIYVVLTMRSDFLGDCAQFQGLPEAINDGQYLIPRMTRDERRFAITGPVRVARGKMSEPLVNRLLNEVGDNPDQLPILQHALMRTWEYWKRKRLDGEPIGVEHYEAVGTMSDALSLHADKAFDELPDERSRRIAEALFKALTERGADNREIRRPTALSVICRIAAASEAEVVAVIEIFRREGRSFLMPPAGVRITGETVIDISHESLIRNWARLKAWVKDEAEAARIYRRLAEAAMAYRTGEGGLLDEVTLQWVQKWSDKYAPTAAWGVRYHAEFDAAIAYLEESRAAHEAAVAERERKQQEELERARREREQAERFAEEQRRAARRLRRYLYAMVALMLISLVTAGWGWASQQRAVKERQRAVAAQQKAQAAQEDTERARAKVAAALEETSKAKTDAEEQARIAEQEKLKAENEEARADEQARLAAEQARLAAERAEQARIAEQAAKTAQSAAEQKARALAANGLFRDATILADRGNFPEAKKKFVETIKGLRESVSKASGGGLPPDLAEGLGDTYVQLGQVSFSSMEGTNLELDSDWRNANEGAQHYDEAASLYAGQAGVSEKAAEALLSVGGTLLKIANDESVGRGVNRDQVELAALSVKPKLFTPGGLMKFDKKNDPKVQLKNKALERYKRAFLLYREIKNPEGARKTAFRIGNFYLRDELKQEQDTTPTLDVGRCAEGAQQGGSNERKALCYFKEMEQLSISQGKDDADIQRLLVLLGALHLDVGMPTESEAYFKRAHQAGLSNHPNADAGAVWADAAEIARAAKMYWPARNLYERAIAAYADAGNFSGQALMQYRLGDLRRKNDGEFAVGYTYDVTEHFKNAVEAYKVNLNKGKFLDGYSWASEFFDIGAYAEEVNEEKLALDAYNVARSLGEARGNLALQARAWAEIGQLQTQESPKQARQSYMRAFALYSRWRDEIGLSNTVESEKAVKEMGRISALVGSLDKEIKAQADAAGQPLTAESLCPYPAAIFSLKPIHQDGEPVSIKASIVYPDMSKLKFKWTLDPSTTRIFGGADSREITFDTTGLGGQRLTATLVVDDGSGLAACRQTLQASTDIEARKPPRK